MADGVFGGDAFETQLRLRRASDGTYRWFDAHAAAVGNDDGAIGRWIISCVDVHDFKRASDTLGVLDHLGHMIAIRDANDRLEYISPSWAHFAGTTEVLSLDRRRQDFVHPEDVHIVEELVRTSFAYPLHIQQHEVRVRGGDGDYRWFLTRSVVLPASAAAPARRLNTLTDIDDLKREQAALAHSAAELSHRAQHDRLTKLANRSGLLDGLVALLAEARTAGTRVVVIYLDIDRFKTINDTLGHAAGDVLLTQTAARINSALRTGDIASRFGGDKFVLAFGVTDADDAAQIVARLQAALRASLELAGQCVAVSCSIGVSMFPEDAQDAADLIGRADAAMYAAKQSGRDTWRSYSPQMRAPSRS